MTVQTIASSRGDVDLVVLVLKISERRFRPDLAACVVEIALVGSDGVYTWHTPTGDTMLNPDQREVTLRVGHLAAVDPVAGVYAPKARVNVNTLSFAVDASCDEVVIA